MDKEIRVVIWDMGGVLLRTEDQSPRKQLAEKLGVSAERLYDVVFNSQSAMASTLGEISAEAHWAQVGTAFQLDNNQLEEFIEQFWSGDQLDRVLMEYIQSLRARVKTALLSNAWSDVRDVMTRRYGLVDYFDYAIFSAEVGLAKPDPEIYRYLLREMDVSAEEAVFIDDIAENVEAAQQLGIHAIQFKEREQVLQALSALPIPPTIGKPKN